MFTGIVEELGEVVGREPSATGSILTIRGPLVASDARDGDSISVNGVCLTVAKLAGDGFVADVMHETLDRTTIGELAPGDPVNLEPAATLGTRLGGHLVQGHVDGVGRVAEVARGERVDLRVGLEAGLSRYLVEKGSVTVDGVSLTVVEVGGATGDDTAVADATGGGATGEDAGGAGAWFSVSLIPTTLAATTLGRRAVGDRVNLEVDMIAKYVERLLRAGGSEVRR